MPEAAIWSRSSPAVREALAYLRSSKWDGQAESLLQWDASTGKRLLEWDDVAGAHAHRVQQARLFINTFRSVINGMRVKAFVNVSGSDGAPRAYYQSEVVAKTPALRERYIAQIVKRMASIASELKFWKLHPKEILAILKQLRKAMG